MSQATETAISTGLEKALWAYGHASTDLESWENLSRHLSKTERLGAASTQEPDKEHTEVHQDLWVLFDRGGTIQDIFAFATHATTLPTQTLEGLFQKALRSPVVWIQGKTADQYFEWLGSSTVQKELLVGIDDKIKSLLQAAKEHDLPVDLWGLPEDRFSGVTQRPDAEIVEVEEIHIHLRWMFGTQPVPRTRHPVRLTPRLRSVIPREKLPRTFTIPHQEEPEQ